MPREFQFETPSDPLSLATTLRAILVLYACPSVSLEDSSHLVITSVFIRLPAILIFGVAAFQRSTDVGSLSIVVLCKMHSCTMGGVALRKSYYNEIVF